MMIKNSNYRSRRTNPSMPISSLEKEYRELQDLRERVRAAEAAAAKRLQPRGVRDAALKAGVPLATAQDRLAKLTGRAKLVSLPKHAAPDLPPAEMHGGQSHRVYADHPGPVELHDDQGQRISQNRPVSRVASRKRIALHPQQFTKGQLYTMLAEAVRNTR